MSDQCIGEIRMFAGNFAPQGWALCNGAMLSITSNPALYSLLGTSYGGDGVTTFGLPDLRSRIPLGVGTATTNTVYTIGEKLGAETVALTAAQIPNHTHALMASSAGATTGAASGDYLAATANSTGAPQQDTHYLPAGATVAKTFTLNTNSVASAGGNAGHPNIMPSFAINFIIALQGVYPQLS